MEGESKQVLQMSNANFCWTAFLKPGETIESVLRKENPLIFKLLKYSLQVLFENKVVLILKPDLHSFVII